MTMKKNVKSPTLKKLSREVSMLRSLVIGMAGKDSEGEYRPEFVEEMLEESETSVPLYEFSSARDFLNRLKKTT
ncbi:MAG: hypothetical protein Q8P52_02105 [bacterium]|nr:hypothetical protein [bacterium]